MFGEAGGSSRNVNYHVTASALRGDGYREQTAFRGNNLEGKLGWQVTPRLHLRAILANTHFFNENPEGLDLASLAEDRRMANPDALTYNEYQKTERQTAGVTGRLDASTHQALTFGAYFRHTRYSESVPSSVQHRALGSPGFNVQYSLRTGEGRFRNSLSLGADLDWQSIDEYRRPNLGGAQEGEGRLSDQAARQNRVGFFAQDRLELGRRWAVLVGLRYDRIDNALTDRLKADSLDLSGDARFGKGTGRVGMSFNVASNLDLYATWGQGFLPPATEELYANPDALGGFNRRLEPATSIGEELGLRGSFQKRLVYDVAAFYAQTTSDFERYRIESRPLETFYHNAGNSKRYGLETQIKWFPSAALAVQLAHTYNHFTYSSYSSFVFPGDLRGNWLPNSPRHQAYIEIAYSLRNWILTVNDLSQSRAYVDATNEPSIGGYSLLGARLAYRLKGTRRQTELFVTGRNLTGADYIAFTEPDPDGNSYQPGPKAELSAGLQVRF